MKRLFLISMYLFIGFQCFSQMNYHININTKNLQGSKIYLELYDNLGINRIKIDSVLVKDTTFHFSGALTQPCVRAAFKMIHKETGIPTNFVLDSGKTDIKLDKLIGPGYRLSLSKINTVSNQIFTELENIWLVSDKKPDRATPIHYMDRYFDQVEFLKSYPNEYYSLLALFPISRVGITADFSKKVLATLAIMNPSLQNSTLGKQIFQERTALIQGLESSQVGKNAPEFSIKDINNTTFENRSLIGKNHLIVFSATWCGPCQKQLPMLKAIYKTYRSKGLEIIYFNLDNDVNRWKKHVKDNRLTWINVSERMKMSSSKIQKSFGVQAIPTCILVNKSGTIVYNSDQEDVGLSKLERNIRRVFLD